MSTAPLLELSGVSRSFGGVSAVDQVDLAIQPGEIVGLIGPNGAGKTTVVNMISGLLPPSRGTIRFYDADITHQPAHRIAAAGITRTYQNIRLFRRLTVLENVVVGQHHQRPEQLLGRMVFSRNSRREQARVEERAQALLQEVGLATQSDRAAGTLPYGDQRRLEIARSLAMQPRLILLDEPAAGMPYGETERLMEIIAGLPGRGVTVLLIEHNMHVVMSVCQRVAVLSFGRKIAEGAPSMIRADPAVVEAYLGPESLAGRAAP